MQIKRDFNTSNSEPCCGTVVQADTLSPVLERLGSLLLIRFQLTHTLGGSRLGALPPMR